MAGELNLVGCGWRRPDVDGALGMTMADGRGIPSRIEPGVGPRDMADPAAELPGRSSISLRAGGGLLVRARLPLVGQARGPA